MKETMGKRISALRKAAGLTQEQLAEKLGVTPQAVSKWENDQSCPDISILPRLAEILGVSCDYLLGNETTDTVTDSESKDGLKKTINIQIQRSKIVFPLAVLVFGAELLIKILLKLDISVWTLLWTDLVTFIGIGMMLSRISPFSIGVSALGIYFSLHAFGVLTFSAPWEIILAIFIVLWGVGMLIDDFTGKKHHHSRTYADGTGERFQQSVEDGLFDTKCSFCSKDAFVYADQLRGGNVALSFGELTLDLTKCVNIAPDAVVEAQASFGDLTIILPKNVVVVPVKSTSFGDCEIKGSPSPDADQQLTIRATVSFGNIDILYRD